MCHPLPTGATPRAEAGAREAAVTGTGAGVKPVTPSSGSSPSFLSILCYSLVSFSLVDLVLSHKFLISSGFADLRLYFWSVSSLAAAMFISLSGLNIVNTWSRSTSTTYIVHNTWQVLSIT